MYLYLSTFKSKILVLVLKYICQVLVPTLQTSSSFSLPSIIVIKLNSRQTICSFQLNADDTISSVMYAFDLSHIVFVLAYTPALKILIPTKALRDVISTNLTLSAPCKALNISSASL